MKNNKKGFTLAELLIVVAVIAVLVAVAIPTFSNQIEKSRQSVDVSNLRGAYAAGKIAAMDGVYTDNTGAMKSIKETLDEDAECVLYYDPDSGRLMDATEAKGFFEKGYSKGTPGANLMADISGLDSNTINYSISGKILPGVAKGNGVVAVSLDEGADGLVILLSVSFVDRGIFS